MYCKKILKENYQKTDLKKLLEKNVVQVLFYDDIPETDLFLLINQSRELGFSSIVLKIEKASFFDAKKLGTSGVTEIQFVMSEDVDLKNFSSWLKQVLIYSKEHSPEFNIVFHLFIYTGFSEKKLIALINTYKNVQNCYLYSIGEIGEALFKLISVFLENNKVENFFFVDTKQESNFQFYTKFPQDKFLKLLL